MPNVLLTTSCNLSCTYCFAIERMKTTPQAYMSLDDVRKVISFLKRSNYPIFRMMGGEPTLHPRFADITNLVLSEGMRIDLLSNATWPTRLNDLLTRISPGSLLFLLNVDHPDTYRGTLWSTIERNLRAIAGRDGVSLSFNIFSTSPRYEYVLDLAERYDFRRIRLSFSLPILGLENAFLPLEDYFKMSSFVVQFAREAERKSIAVGLDNAMPLCMFSFKEAGELILKGVLDLQRNARCEPIVDIGPDLSIWSCFCLSEFENRRLEEFSSLEEIRRYYAQTVRPYQDEVFPLEACYTCNYRELWGCQGGCIAFSMKQAESAQPRGAGLRWRDEMVLSLADVVSLQKYDLPEPTFVMRNRKTGAQVQLGSSLLSLLHILDGRHTANAIVSSFSQRTAGTNSDPVTAFEQDVMADGFKDVLLGLLREGFLVASDGSIENGTSLVETEIEPTLQRTGVGASEDLSPQRPR